MTQHAGKRVAVVGLGVMGTGIARAIAAAGLTALLFDLRQGRAIEARSEIVGALERRQHPIAARAPALLVPAASLEDLGGCDLLIEAINEDIDDKTALLRSLDELLPTPAVIASNTSSLPLAALAKVMAAPERFVGLHFFVPAHANPLVEVGRASGTAPETVAQAVEFARALGKTPLICRDAPGFIVNRFYLPLINEAMRVVEEGLLSAAEADAAAIEAFGLAIGPFAVCRMGRLSTTLAAVSGLSNLGRFYAPCAALVERGNAEDQWPDEKLDVAYAPPAMIVERLRAAVFLAILDALDDGVAEPEAFDQAARMGLRFGRPPVTMMAEFGRDRVERAISQVAGRYGTAIPQSILQIPLEARVHA